MEHRAVLDVDAVADAYRVDVAAQYGVEPHAAVVAHHNVAYDGGVVGEVAVFTYLRSESSNFFY